MDFASPARRKTGEPILPMINVVFLLLIFFLLSSQIAPRAPFPVVPPQVDTDSGADPGATLFLSADGRLFFEGLEGDAALLRLSSGIEKNTAVILRADAAVSAQKVAALISRLRAAGAESVVLVGSGQ